MHRRIYLKSTTNRQQQKFRSLNSVHNKVEDSSIAVAPKGRLGLKKFLLLKESMSHGKVKMNVKFSFQFVKRLIVKN